MTDKTVQDLTAASSLTGAELIHVVQGGNSRRTTLNALRDTFDSGWANFVDAATALEANAITLTAGVRTLVTIDAGVGSITSHVGNSGITWAGNAHTGATVGDSWTWRLSLRGKKSGGTTAYLLVDQDISAGAGTIIGMDEKAIRSDNQSQIFSFGFSGYSMETFAANGMRFYITASQTCQIWGKGVFIRRDYNP